MERGLEVENTAAEMCSTPKLIRNTLGTFPLPSLLLISSILGIIRIVNEFDSLCKQKEIPSKFRKLAKINLSLILQRHKCLLVAMGKYLTLNSFQILKRKVLL
jgi:hypothetical protein